MFSVLLVSCATLCASHMYPKGFDHPDKRACWCADLVEKAQPPPLEIHLKWKYGTPEDERKAIVTPDVLKEVGEE